jgi:hypothetical protein
MRRPQRGESLPAAADPGDRRNEQSPSVRGVDEDGLRSPGNGSPAPGIRPPAPGIRRPRRAITPSGSTPGRPFSFPASPFAGTAFSLPNLRTKRSGTALSFPRTLQSDPSRPDIL